MSRNINFIFSEKRLVEVRNTSPFFARKKGVGGVGGSCGGGGGFQWEQRGDQSSLTEFKGGTKENWLTRFIVTTKMLRLFPPPLLPLCPGDKNMTCS